MSADLIETWCTAVDADAMMAHLQTFAQRVKLSGTPEEMESFQYLRTCLDSYGYVTNLIMHPAFISLPGAAQLELAGVSPRCITHALSCTSAPGGTRGAVVYLGRGTEQDFAGRDVRGQIVLLDGMATPGAARRASLAGAAGQIHISPHEHIHEMCVSPVWGSPGTETLDQLPSTVVVSIALADGEALKHRLASGDAIEAVLHAEVDTGWRETPILTAELMPPGAAADAPFVMFSGHHDTWYYGVMDNGGANATMLEVARLMAPQRDHWQRGLRLCFWSGHSHGRYSGSAWYADNHWMELERRCAVHVNVDSTGARGNTMLADAPVCSELLGFARDCVGRRGDQMLDGLRMPRAGDHSFWGIGVPSMFMGMGEQPASAGAGVTAGLFGAGTKGAGFGWWWHTPDDTLDKMDPELLVRDTRIYVETVGRLLTDTVLPLDYAGHGAALLEVLTPLQQALGARLDLTEAIRMTHALIDAATAARQHATDTAEDDPAGADRHNRALMHASRAMVPMDYTDGDRFAHGPALPQSAYPVLDPVRHLAASDAPAASPRGVSARRACNRLLHALDAAAAALRSV